MSLRWAPSRLLQPWPWISHLLPIKTPNHNSLGNELPTDLFAPMCTDYRMSTVKDNWCELSYGSARTSDSFPCIPMKKKQLISISLGLGAKVIHQRSHAQHCAVLYYSISHPQEFMGGFMDALSLQLWEEGRNERRTEGRWKRLVN